MHFVIIFLANSIPLPDHDYDKYINNKPSNPNSIFLTPCDDEEILMIIKSLKSKSSCGIDNISNKLIKKNWNSHM